MTRMDNLPAVVSAEEWLAARKELLAKEKKVDSAPGRKQGSLRYFIPGNPLGRP